MSETRTPLCDAYADSISAVEIVKHPIREFADAIRFAKKLERKAAHFDALREALEKIASFAPGNGDVCEIIAKTARKALAAADEIGGD